MTAFVSRHDRSSRKRTAGQREQRHRFLRELLRSASVQSQGELQKRLEAAGLRAEQATISRDLHALGVVKGADGYILPDSPIAPQSVRIELVQLVRQYLTAIDCAGQMVVLRTGPGRAAPLGLALDNAGLSGILDGILGTIAGDDTIFVAMASIDAAEQLKQALRAVADGADPAILERVSASETTKGGAEHER